MVNASALNRFLLGTVSIFLIFFTAQSLWGIDDVEISTTGKVIEVRKGGSAPWKLRYGLAASNSSDKVDETHLVKEGPNRAYFSHGQCLRRLDTERGMVLGRWLMPGIVTRIVPQGENGKAEITTQEPLPGKDPSVLTFVFDPLHPEGRTTVTHESILENLLPEREAVSLYGIEAMSAYRARALIQEMQEAVRRDPLSPWFRIILGKLLLEAGDPGAETTFEEAIRPLSSYVELLPMSGFLENLRVGRIADEAFERGYRNFLQGGNDPRLVTSILPRLWLYPVDWKKIAPERKAAVAERIYQLTPYAEAADLAWQEYSLSATTPEEHRLWLNRAEEARKRSGHIFAPLILQFDIAMLVNVACGSACWLFIAICYVRYRLQRRYDRTGARPVEWRNRLAFFNLQYWSVPQRIGFLFIFPVAWLCYGWMGQSIGPAMLMGEAPISMASGNLATPSTRQFLQQRLSATPGRDFLMAFSFQQAGDYPAATRLYQLLPQYAESWNNLGAILRIQGREIDGVAAFHHALQLDPNLPEAAFNLGRPIFNYWVQIHQQYVPNAPMLSPPPRRVWLNAFAGGSLSRRLARASWGQLHPWDWNMKSMAVTSVAAKASSVLWVLSEAALALTVLLFIFPDRPVQQAPGIAGKILGLLFPGIAREWSYAGGLVLVVWIFLLTQLIATKWVGSPYILSYIATPNVVRIHGAGTSPEQAVSLINPGWVWLYVAPAALALCNLIVSSPTIRARVSGGTK
jgi:tetratricopeptide (TPR) repeat protein